MSDDREEQEQHEGALDGDDQDAIRRLTAERDLAVQDLAELAAIVFNRPGDLKSIQRQVANIIQRQSAAHLAEPGGVLTTLRGKGGGR